MDHHDWTRLDAPAITERALKKCIDSRDPRAVEPGRYTAILEPQAVADLMGEVLGASYWMDRQAAESCATGTHMMHLRCDSDPESPLAPIGFSKIGKRIIDARLSVSEDPMDPELSYPPFWRQHVYHPVEWFKNGVLTNLGLDRQYAIRNLYKDTGLPGSDTFRISVTGETMTLDQMIATTKRGILVTRFSNVRNVEREAAVFEGFTRDGLWLIENGAISRAIKNFRFVELPWALMNRIEALGKPERVFRMNPHSLQPIPAIVPAMKVQDFAFTQLSNAV